MNIPIGNIVSASEIQRNYRKVFDKVKRTKEVVVVLRDNKPDVAVVDIQALGEMEKRLKELEIQETLRVVKEGRKEYKEGRTIKVKSLQDLL